MIYMTISEHELRRALVDIERAKSQGFDTSPAILRIFEVGDTLSDDRAEYTDELILCAGDRDFGRIGNSQIGWYQFKDGKVIEEPS